jgi:uncharacterized protein affecting Mg2+/Co2+ transport
VLCLFGLWRRRELRSTFANKDDDDENESEENSYAGDDDNDDDEARQAIKDQAEAARLLAWLAPSLTNADTDAWMDETLWTTPAAIIQAIRQAYRQEPAPELAADQRAWAIRAFQYLVTQSVMLGHGLVTVHEEAGVRLVTVARCVGRSASTARSADAPVVYKYRFVYRIRMENTSLDQTVQLLGRSWIIQEGGSASDHSLGTEQTSIKVHAPHTGAVGQHPVLAPGQFFEYMSGCDLATESGLMQGCFHFCHVPAGTPASRVGQTVPALHGDNDDTTTRRFEVPVAPFPLAPDRLPIQFET